MANLDNIDTIVIVMLENRSFDHIVGHLHHPHYGNRPDIDGLKDPQTTTDYDNVYDNRVYKPSPGDGGPLLHDLPHTRPQGGNATRCDQPASHHGRLCAGLC